MLISHRYKFIFVKTYKTAGTSTEAFFQRFCLSPLDQTKYHYKHGADESITKYGIIGHRLDGNKGTHKWFNHKSVASIKGDLGENLFNSYTKICNIRNPYDIVVSSYLFNHRHLGDVTLTPEILEDWLKSKYTIRYLNMNKTLWFSTDFKYEYIRHENIEEDIKSVCEKLGIEIETVNLPSFKVSPGRKHYREYYSEEAKKVVADLYSDELKTFNYEF